ncbi:MAG: hypothetical protein FJ213_08475 [Ignavibacteria bacterium]|nr:hypothetical protein [Ignavibacteria bacterium]
MNYNEGKNREQTILFPDLIDDYITSENPEPDYLYDKFIYDEVTDSYCCPQGQTLNYYTTSMKDGGRKIRMYRTAACQKCSVSKLCTTSPRGRYIHRWEDKRY